MAVGQTVQKKPDPCSFVIFGVTGDLAHRLVVPALYNLAATGLLPDKFCLVGITRDQMSNEALRDSLMKGLRQFATRSVDDTIARRLLECVTCIEADPKRPATFDTMRKQLDELESARQTGGNRLFYLATPPLDDTSHLAGPLGGTDDAFVAKFDDVGHLLWTKQLTSSAYEGSLGVSADGLGSVYSVGGTDGDLGAPNVCFGDAFIAKIADVPEPATGVLLAIASLLLSCRRRRTSVDRKSVV